MLAPLLFALCLVSPPTSPKVVRDGEKVLLVEGPDRLVLRGQQDPRFSLGNGAELEVSGTYRTQLRLLLRGQRVAQVDMKDLGFAWLQQDTLWGGPEEGVEARKQAFERLGLRAEVHEVLPVPGGVMAVVTWRALWPSEGPVWAQHLVRIEVGPGLEVTPLRLLPGGRGSYLDPITRRLFREGPRVLLWLPGKVVEIDAAGTDVSDYAEVPADLAPIGLIERRWLLLTGGDPAEGRFILGALDLDKRKAFVLYREPARGTGLTATLAGVPELGRYLLLTRAVDARGKVERFTVEVPTGLRAKIHPGAYAPPSYTWREYAYTDDGSFVTLYDARTGRFLRQLPVPRRKPR